ncbi:hypothetical protein FAIPA1_190111 [Frankia sp. AiPs1]|uniref:hypothetical protein n=1 Tax=Frankia sp. AiPa1 TaxID=573492 RepID=UPI00202AE27E|nr:hypothetical protein [Frankia sp. AiPa1]MCL9761377.1 hypothetical protein [Frankia sp. AiPa1]
MLESVRRRLRGLIRLIDKSRRKVVYTDFEDELGEISEGGIAWQPLGTDFEKKIRTYLRSHENQLAVVKLRRNRQITSADLDELTQIFLDAGLGTREDVEQADVSHAGLGLFLTDRQAEDVRLVLEGRCGPSGPGNRRDPPLDLIDRVRAGLADSPAR